MSPDFKLVVLVFLAITSSLAEEPGAESDIYPYVVQALRELKFRQLAEETGVANADTPGSVCYDDLGCFDRDGTFKHLKQLPDTPENVATMFLLYTRSNPTTPQIIDYTKPKTVLRSNLNHQHPTKFITHGFGGKNNITWVINMKNEFLAKEDANIIVVDWNKGAAIPHYINAVANTELVGAQAAALFLFMKDKMQFSEKNLHVIGFSLGAHVSGFVGKRLQKLRGIKPARITGLDPASPLFEDYGGDVHLYKDDGDFVDVVHTNAESIMFGGVGIGAAIGHVDFYPNGGIRQPGCASTLTGLFKDMMNKNLRQRACNHERAAILFTESIRSESCFFHSYSCEDFKFFQNGECFSCEGNSCGLMGYKHKGSGKHYFLTKATKPYCAENIKVSLKYAEKVKKSYGELIVFFTGKNGEKQNVTMTKKDERLLPDTIITAVAPMSTEMKPLKEIGIQYNKYNGWISKGTPTFKIASLSLIDSHENTLFNTCGDRELEDQLLHWLPPTDETC